MLNNENFYQNQEEINYELKNTEITIDNDENELKNRHVCHVCFRKFSKLSHLKRHNFSHTKEPFNCNHCDKSYARNDHLQRHLVTHGLNSKPYICPFEGCKMTFYDSSKFRKHYPIHNRPKDNCIIFGRKIQITKVDDKYMLNCPITGCTMMTKTVHGMRKHIFSHNNKKEGIDIENQIIRDEESSSDVKRVYICGYKGCNYSYTRKSNAIAHINVYHKNLTFKCDKCNLVYKWKRSLKKHKCKGEFK